jgi:uroporphyrinogen decarboxylase
VAHGIFVMQSTATITPGSARAFPASAKLPNEVSARERFLRACNLYSNDFPPVWMMRQAGRALPEYRALKERHSFLEMVRTPGLACEVTLQPLRRFGFDAAILFSDILVVPEALGQGYRFRDAGGIEMDWTIRTAADIDKLETAHLRERLQYVSDAIHEINKQLRGQHALIGFSGSPWTLMNFMLEGGSSKSPKAALDLLRLQPELFARLADKLTEAVTDYLRMQIESGVDALQIFDTLGSLLPQELYPAGSGLWIKRIVQNLNTDLPVIVFSKGVRSWEQLAGTGADVVGIDHGIGLRAAADLLPATVAVQGNLDPEVLLQAPAAAARETERLLQSMRGRNGWVFNLGHGVPPNANLESIAAVVETLRRGA